jgi:multidrug efflux pump subunit AcrA (membrane-fusion protein)
VFRLAAPRPPADEREQRIFLIYGALAAGYITLILAFCAVNSYGWLSRTFGAVGAAVFAVSAWFVVRRQLRGWGHTMLEALRKHSAALRAGRHRPRLLAGAGAVLIIGFLIPWPITVSGPFTVAAGGAVLLTAPDSGVVERVNVQEGTRVAPGAPLLRLRNFALERQALAARRSTDSMAVAAAKARAAQRYSEVAEIEAARSIGTARLAGLEAQISALRVRAISPGVVLTPRPGELEGHRVYRGEILLQLGQPDTVEARITLSGAGATSVRANQFVRLLPDASSSSPLNSKVGSVSAAAEARHAIEGRLQLPGSASWYPGMTGRARITLRQSNLWGAVWWAVRKGIRSDILL